MEQIYSDGFEALLGDFKHIMKIQAGLETLHEDIDFDGPLGDEVEYATTVLKLNDLDLKEVAGNEGFMDGVKKAGTKVKEFIKQLIAYIRSFFKPKEADVKEVEGFLRSMRRKRDAQDLVNEATNLATSGVIPESIVKTPKTGTPLGDYNRHRKDRAEQTRDRVRRLSTEERSLVKQAAEEVSQNADIQDKVVMLEDNVRLRVNNTINRFANTALTAMNEMARIDPTGESRAHLKLATRVEVLIARLVSESKNTSTDIAENIATLCNCREQVSVLKDTATKELDFMASRGDYDDRVLSRATAIVQELVKALEALCNGVLSVDSTIRKTEGEVIDKITREIFRKAASSMGGDVSKALSELNSIAGM